MFAIDQTGGGRNHGTYSVDEPLRTVVAKANATCIEFSLVELEETFRTNCRKAGIGNDSAATFLDFLIKELKEKAKIDAKPWIYVYYSSGAEGADIDTPLPTVRAKAGTAVCYPVIEFDGRFIRIDLLYRMLTVRELQRAMGFPEDMKWAGSNQEDMVRAIGNSVSHGVARALAAACWTQNPDVTGFLEPAG
jgi:site-specific DNA-cytosine methylase